LAVVAQFSQIVGFSAITLLLLMFAWLYERDRRQRTLNWLQGWIAIEIHFAGNLLRLTGWISSQVADWLAYSTLLFAAASFFLSVSGAFLTKSARRIFWIFVFAPAMLYVTLLVSGEPATWTFDLILGLIFVASTWIFTARAKRKVASSFFCILLGAIPAAAVMFTTGDPSQGMDVLLFDAFAVTGVAWRMHFRRVTPGVILASISFIAWGCVWTGAGLLARLGAHIPEQSVLWDLPKYFVAFGMLITLLEEETEALQQEVRDRRQAENALRESAFFLGESQRIAQLGTCTFDFSSGSCKMSPVAEQILGIGPDADCSVPVVIDLLREGDRDEVTRRLRESVFATGERFEREIVITRKNDGAERYIHVRAAVVEMRPGVQAINGTLQDVTESKISEQELIQSKKMESIGRLAGGIAHDFNNLLTIVNGYSELVLTRMKDADPLRNFVDEIRNAGVRAAELTHQLLAFSRRQTLQPVDLDLNAVIVETERLLAHLIAKNIQIITVLAPGLSKIKADPGQLTQVLLNLAVNARDAMPRGGRLTIETANVSRLPRTNTLARAENRAENPSGNHVTFVRISVTDTGSGMDEETQKHLFEPFFTTKPRSSGTGLGLSTVYGIVKQSNGYINVRSEVEMGTRFDIYLPSSAVAVAEEGVEAQPPTGSGVQWKGKTILVVDDQRAARKLVLTVLQGSGYRTLEASNGEEALALVRERSYSIDLLLTDVVMPGISGRTLVERMRKIRPGTPAVLISGYTDHAMDSELPDAEFVFLQKPFSPQRLLELVEETLQMV
jgi:signal transduction histidine kinase